MDRRRPLRGRTAGGPVAHGPWTTSGGPSRAAQAAAAQRRPWCGPESSWRRAALADGAYRVDLSRSGWQPARSAHRPTVRIRGGAGRLAATVAMWWGPRSWLEAGGGQERGGGAPDSPPRTVVLGFRFGVRDSSPNPDAGRCMTGRPEGRNKHRQTGRIFRRLACGYRVRGRVTVEPVRRRPAVPRHRPPPPGVGTRGAHPRR